MAVPGQPGAVAGDRVQIRLFEISTPDAAGVAADGQREVAFERLDLGGVYEIDDNGELGLPLLGRVKARGVRLPCIEAAVTLRFFEVLHGTVSVSAVYVTRPPVAITGAVRSPGTYVVTPGMNLAALLASAGANAGMLDAREAKDLREKKAELERVAAGVALSLARVEAMMSGSAELDLDEDARRAVTAALGQKRLDAEADLLRTGLSVVSTSAVATASLLAGFDSRIVVTENRLAVAEEHARLRDDRTKEFAALGRRGVVSAMSVDDYELASMALERTRLEVAANLTELRAARNAAARQAEIALVERSESQRRQIVDLLEQKSLVEAELARIDARLSQLVDAAHNAATWRTMPVTVQRWTQEGTVNIAGEPSMPVFPGDVVLVGVDLGSTGHLTTRRPERDGVEILATGELSR